MPDFNPCFSLNYNDDGTATLNNHRYLERDVVFDRLVVETCLIDLKPISYYFIIDDSKQWHIFDLLAPNKLIGNNSCVLKGTIIEDEKIIICTNPIRLQESTPSNTF
jgi:hypothetical protein